MGKWRHDKEGNIETAVQCSHCKSIIYWRGPDVFGKSRDVYAACDACAKQLWKKRKR